MSEGPATAAAVHDPPLGIEQLERLRRSIVEQLPPTPDEFTITHAVLDRIGIGLEPAHRFMSMTQPTAEQLDHWALEQLGGRIDPEVVTDANCIAAGEVSPGRRAERALIERTQPALSTEDLAFWDEHGYVILRHAAPDAACAALRQAIYDHLGADPDDPDSWYRGPRQQGVMVQLFNAPGIAEIHASPRIRKAFSQLAGTSDLIMSSDRCGFNPPVRPENPYGGAGLHLDLESFEPPIASHLQGILYLSDTIASQGALRLIPGFHRRIDEWVRALPPEQHPTVADFESLGPVPIAAGSGDLIIWQATLPHGPSANTATQPRIVHYLRMYPRPVPSRTAGLAGRGFRS
jgi:hypothetical protein